MCIVYTHMYNHWFNIVECDRDRCLQMWYIIEFQKAIISIIIHNYILLFIYHLRRLGKPTYLYLYTPCKNFHP